MSGFSFGAPAANNPQQPAASAFSFGAPKQANTTGGFGATTAAAPAFGAQPAASGFGAQTAATGFGAQPAFGGFGSAQPAAPAFGAAATPAFGAQTAAAPAFGALGTAPPAFGATAATSAAAPSFGTSSFSFGTQAANAAAASIAPTAASAAPTNFSFGAAASTATSSALPTLSNTTTALPTLGLGGGSFSFAKPAATTSASLNFGTVTTTTTAAPAPFVGLGGIEMGASQPKAGDSKQDIKVKETQVPDEIAKTVDALKSYVKTQKTLSSDIGRTSTSKLSSVSGEMVNLQWTLQEISNSVEANYNQIKLLRKETSKTIQSVEMAQRTQDTPVGLQFENNAPFQFFQNLVAKYEHDLINFRQQITLTERHMHSLTNPQNVSPEDLKRGFKQINESFISLAGRLHEIHQKVEAQKEQYLNLRKYRLRDNTNVFAKLDAQEDKVDTSRITAGPTPFSNITAISNFGKSFHSAAAGASAGGGGGSATQTGK